MKLFTRLILMGSVGLALIFLTTAPSFATVVGDLYTGGNGTVTVTPTGITFTENDTSGGSTEVGTGTDLTFSGGPLLVGQPIDINGGDTITPASLADGVAITFPDEPTLTITLFTFGPGSSTPCSAAITVGESCSPLLAGDVLSPIILTDTSTGTVASLSVAGTATDGTGTSELMGNFSTTITGQTPEELATDASYTTTSSGTFAITSLSSVPEPRSIWLVVLTGLLMGLFLKRKKSET
jgi:hypothetical protein